jgi:drug/metabolite transporter (DMT)-like permease
VSAAPSPRALGWAPSLAVGVLGSGLAAGVWKHAAIELSSFCVLFVAAKAVVGAGLWAARGRRGDDPGSRPFLAFSLLAAALNGLAWIAYFTAFERGPLAIVQTVTATYTAVAAVLAVLFLRERLSGVQVAGVGIIVLAGMLLAYAGEDPTAAARGGWVPACLAAVGLWGANAVAAKHAWNLPGADAPRFFVAHALGLGATVLPYGVWLAPAGHAGAGGAAAAWLVVLLYTAGDLGIYAASARVPASVVTPLIGLYPLPAIAYGALVLGDRPGELGWAGIALALPGTVLVLPAADNPVARLLARSKRSMEVT